MSAPVQVDPSVRFGMPRILFEGTYAIGPVRNYDVSPDGRFLMLKNAGQTIEEDAPSQITVVFDWFQELTERGPIRVSR